MSDELAPELRRALADLLLGLVDTKQQLGYRYAEWCTGAPTLEAATAASAMAQAELGHSRAMLPLLDAFGDLLPAEALGDQRQITRAAPGLELSFAGWTDFIAANTIIDGVLTTLFELATSSTYKPLQSRTRKMIEEERYHSAHGQGWTLKLARGGGSAVELLRTRVAELLDATLGWLESFDIDTLAQAGVLSGGRDELRSRFLQRLQPTLKACGLADEALAR
ncbi:MAG: hypothetical protein KatS3mg057_3217 [Herpetosiphonaceae bacterium]|nr:MAG: hypothetical protein KatS3mg057_3217 [Herpetosiphonaceae bacterium]